MTKDKHFEEMVEVIGEIIGGYNCGMLVSAEVAEHLTNKGYRKASDLAREIFEEIEKEIELALDSNYRAKKEHYNHSVIPNYDNFKAMCDGKIYAMRGLLDFIAELKKKYTESEKDDV
jgi:replicative DNA helicase